MSTKKKGEIDLSALGPLVKKSAQAVLRYAGILFIVLVAAVYSFVVLRINTLSNAQPTDSDVSAQSAKTTAVPIIDPKVIQQLQELKDNSVNVRTFFEQDRGNPFQE